MPEIAEKEAAEAAAQEKAQEKAAEQREARRRARETAGTARGTAVTRRARFEVNREREVRSPELTEVNARRLERGAGVEQRAVKPFYKEVKPLELRFKNMQELQEYDLNAWEKLSKNRSGQALFKETGGKEGLLKELNKGGDYDTRVAAECNRARIEPTGTGNNVHRVSELYKLEKNPKAILSGELQVEQRIDYMDQNGEPQHVELDEVIRKGDKVYIRDHKPVNLTDFERTRPGKEWAAWAEKNVGPNFREHVMDGNSPFFQKETGNSMPSDIRKGLRDFLSRAEKKAQHQLDKYRTLYSEAADVDPRNIHTSILPYYVFR